MGTISNFPISNAGKAFNNLGCYTKVGALDVIIPLNDVVINSKSIVLSCLATEVEVIDGSWQFYIAAKIISNLTHSIPLHSPSAENWTGPPRRYICEGFTFDHAR